MGEAPLLLRPTDLMLRQTKYIFSFLALFAFNCTFAFAATERWDASDLSDGAVGVWVSQGPLAVSAGLPASGGGTPLKDSQGLFFDGASALQISPSANFLDGVAEWTATVVFKSDGSQGQGGASRSVNPEPDDLREWEGNAALIGVDLPGSDVGEWGMLLNSQSEVVMGSGGSPSTGYVWQDRPLNDGQWHVVTTTFSSTSVNRTLFVDGAPVHAQQQVDVNSPEGAINFACNTLDSPDDRAYFTGHISTIILSKGRMGFDEVIALHDSLGFEPNLPSGPVIELFDGQSFDGLGMSIQNTAGSKIGDDVWEITPEGYAYGMGSGNKQSGLYTISEAYGGYELTFEYKWTGSKTSANSGVWVHGGSDFVDSLGAYPAAIEIQLRQGKEGDLLRKQTYLEAEPGWPTAPDAGNPDFRIIRRADPEASANGVWHSVRILTEVTPEQGSAISVWINDVFVNKGINCERSQGRIVFQAEGSDIQYRNIELRPQGSETSDPQVSWTPPAPIVYGEPLGAAQLSASASVAGSFSYTPSAGTVLDAGAAQSLRATFTPDDASSYNTVVTTVAIDVEPAALTLSADAQQRIYGIANPAFSYSATGFVNGDSLADLDSLPELSSTADSASAVGDYLISLSGASSSNYAISYQTSLLSIVAAPLEVRALDASRLYGAANPSYALSYSGFQNGEGVEELTTKPTATTAASSSSPVGEYLISVSGGIATNYTFSYLSGALSVKPAPLMLSADDKDRSYGEDNPALTFSASGFVNGEDLSDLDSLPELSTAAIPESDAGDYAINIKGGSAQNYTISRTPASLRVGKGSLTVSAEDVSRTYGDLNPVFSLSYSGFALGDGSEDLETIPIVNTVAVAGSPVGTYSLSVSGGEDENYEFVYKDGSLSVLAAELLLAADEKARAFGEANPELSFSASGFVGGDDISVLDSPPVLSSSALPTSPPGDYAISISGASAENYRISYLPGTLSVGEALLSVSVVDAERVYGSENPVFALEYSGFVAGEGPGDLDVLPVASSVATASSPVGTYAIELGGGADSKYVFNYSEGELVVQEAALRVEADDKSRSYGSPNPNLSFTVSGLRNGEGLSVLERQPAVTTEATLESPVGEYVIDVSGAAAINYRFEYVSGKISVDPALLTVKAKDVQVYVGDAIPEFYPAISGFVLGEKAEDLEEPIRLSTDATLASPAGFYDIVMSAGSDPRYAIQAESGKLELRDRLKLLVTSLSDGVLGLSIHASPSQSYLIQISANLTDWADLRSVTTDSLGRASATLDLGELSLSPAFLRLSPKLP